MDTKSNDSPGNRRSEVWRARVAADLEAHRAEELRNWGGIDEKTLVLYELGKCTEEEKARVEQAMRDYPAVRKSVEIGRKLTELWEVAPLPLSPEIRPPRLPVRHVAATNRPAVAAAAPAAFDPASIQIEPADGAISIVAKRKPFGMPGWLAAAAALIAAVSIGAVIHYWNVGGKTGRPNIQADVPPHDNRQEANPSPPVLPPKKSLVSVPENRETSPVKQDRRPTFKEALLALESRIREGKEANIREAVDKLSSAYPGEMDAIKASPVLATALNQLPTDQPDRKAVVKQEPPTPPVDAGPKLDDLLTAIARYPTDRPGVTSPELRELWQRIVRHAGEYQEASAASPQIADLRRDVLRLRLEAFPLYVQGKELRALLERTQPSKPAELEAELKTQIARVVDDPRLKSAGTGAKKAARLLCVLPPGLREGSIDLYGQVQEYARSQHGTLDPALADFLLAARRPTDTLGMMIPVYWPDIEALNPQEVAALQEQKQAIAAVAELGLKVKLINRFQTDQAIQSATTEVTIRQAKEINVDIYAYVNTDGGGRLLQDVTNEMQQWNKLYPKMYRGIFVDNIPNNPVKGIEKLDYFKALYQKAIELDHDWKLVGCADKLSDEPYLTLSQDGMLCVDSSVTEPKAKEWQAKYDPSRFAAVIRRPDESVAVKEIILRTSAAHYGWIYVTQKAVAGPNEFKTLPAYLLDEALVIRQLNADISGNVKGQTTKKSATKKSTTKKPK